MCSTGAVSRLAPLVIVSHTPFPPPLPPPLPPSLPPSLSLALLVLVAAGPASCAQNRFIIKQQVFGHNPYRQHVTARDGHITDKAAQVLGVIRPSEGRGGGASAGREGGSYRRSGPGRGSRGAPRSMVEEEVMPGAWSHAPCDDPDVLPPFGSGVSLSALTAPTFSNAIRY